MRRDDFGVVTEKLFAVGFRLIYTKNSFHISLVMFIDQLAKLQKAKAELAAAEAKLAADRVAALARLPADYGFGSDLNAFLKAVKDAFGKKGPKSAKAGKAAKSAKPAAEKAKAPVKAAKKGKRAKITEEVKAQVKQLADAGKTGAEIAAALGISAPSVQNIKKELGLVRPRASVAAAAPAAPAVEAPAPAEVVAADNNSDANSVL